MENPIVRWVTAAMGRIETHRWNEEGLGLPFPEGWTYYKNLLPYAMDDELVDRVVSSVTPEHHERAWFLGTPEEVARKIQPYLEAGVDWVMPIDYLPVVGSLEDAAAAAARGAELCRNLKRLDVPAAV